MSNIIDGIKSGQLINSSTTGAAGSTNGEAFSELLASEMLELSGNAASTSQINDMISAAQLSGGGGASMASLRNEILSQVQSVSGAQNANAASAYQASANAAESYWRAPVRVEGTTEYFDYDITADFEPTGQPNGWSNFSGGG